MSQSVGNCALFVKYAPTSTDDCCDPIDRCPIWSHRIASFSLAAAVPGCTRPGGSSPMAKYRCPSCGAAHKEPPGTCRLCGYVMDGSVEIPTGAPTVRPAAAQEARRGQHRPHRPARRGRARPSALSSSTSTSGNATVTKVVDKLPGQAAPPTGGSSSPTPRAASPSASRLSRRPPRCGFPSADNGQLTGWLGTVGEAPQIDTQLYVVYGKIHPKPGETAADTVSRLGNTKMAIDGGFIESQPLTSYQGYPAIRYTINRLTFQGKHGLRERHDVPQGRRALRRPVAVDLPRTSRPTPSSTRC